MQEYLLSFQQLLDAEYLLSHGGFYIVCLIVFAETGLFFGFFLPGDYLLFLAGLFCALHKIDVDIFETDVFTALHEYASAIAGYITILIN